MGSGDSSGWMSRPLDNQEQIYRSIYFELCDLYIGRKINEAQKLA